MTTGINPQDLGPLPERRIRHVYNASKGYECDCWTEDAVREYAAREVAAERERCARVAEGVGQAARPGAYTMCDTVAERIRGAVTAAAVRASQ